jgi:tetratricopeptide (TPR) repeat protein
MSDNPILSKYRWLANPLLHLALIVIIGIVAYCNTFHAPFQYDDFKGMLDKPYVQDLRYLSDLSLVQQFSMEHAFRVRFIGFLSFALNYAIHGDAVEGYHIVNLAIHLLNALLVYCLVRLTLRTPYFRNRSPVTGHRPSPAEGLLPASWSLVTLFAALLFVAHPVQTQAVTYIVQRIASLATLFCLATVVLYIKARLALEDEGWKGRGALWYGASLFCALMAMNTKEIAFTLPLAVCMYELMFFSGTGKKRLICLVPLLLTMLVIPLSMLTLAGTGGALEDVASATRAGSDLSRAEYFFTELRVIVTYIRLLFLPVNQNLYYDYPVYRTLFTPPVFLSFLFLLAIFSLAVCLLYRSSNKTSDQRPVTSDQNPALDLQPSAFSLQSCRLISFGIFWFFLTLSVESSIIPIKHVIFEHRLYLPSVGVFVAIAACLGIALQRLAPDMKRGGALFFVIAGVIVLVLNGTTYARNGVWQSQESLWQDVVNKSPAKAVGYQYLGIALFERGEIERAFACFDRSLAIDPDFAEAYSNRGTLNAQIGRYDRAIDDFARAVDISPSLVDAWSNLGLAYSYRGEQDKALSSLARAIALDPGFVKALNNMGLVQIRIGRPLEAIGYLDRALSLNGNYGLAWFNRGRANLLIGRPDLAVSDLGRSIVLDSRLTAAYTIRGDAFARLGDKKRAETDYRVACERNDREGCRRLAAQPGN